MNKFLYNIYTILISKVRHTLKSIYFFFFPGGYECDESCCCGGSCCCSGGNIKSPDSINFKRADVPLAWGLYFQDGASPSFEGIVDLHNRIMFYLVVILFGVGWILLSIIWNFNKSKNKLVYRYLNHGKYVPIQKYSNFNYIILKSIMYILLRSYTTLSNNPLDNNGWY